MKRSLPIVVAVLGVVVGLLAWKGKEWGVLGGGGAADGGADGPAPEEIAGSGGLRGRPGSDKAGPDPAVWEGEPVGVLDLGLGPAAVSGKVTDGTSPLRFARVSAVVAPPAGDRGARTTKDGRFEIRGLPTGVVDLRVSAERFRSKTVTTPALVDAKTIDVGEIALKPLPPMTDGIEVKVVDAAGKPVSGARVSASSVSYGLYIGVPESRTGIQGVIARDGSTDEHGVVRLFPMPAEKYDVAVRAQGYALEAVANVVVAAGRVEKVKIVLSPGMAISGLVVDLKDQPVGRAFVNGLLIPAFRGYETVLTDDKGHFTLGGLVSGQYMLFAGQDAKGEGTATSKAGATDARIQLKGAGTVTGRVLNSDGTPATKFSLRPYTGDFFRYYYSQKIDVSDPEGKFSISLAPGSYTIDAQGESGQFKTGTSVTVAVDQTQKVEITLPALGVVKGMVVDPEGDALKDVEVYVNVGGMPPTAHREWYARTDADGKFAIKGMTLEATKLHVRHAAYALKVVEAKPAAPDSVTEITVRLAAGGRVLGKVTTPDGAPVAGEQFNLYQGMDWMRAKTTFSGADGTFTFTAVAPGTWSVSQGRFENNAAGQNKGGIVVAEGGTATVEFQVQGTSEAAGTVSGVVTVAGAPAVEATVSAWDDRGFDAAITAKTDAEGKYSVSGLKAGRVTVMVQTEGGVSTTKNVRIQAPDQPARLDVSFGSASVQGAIVGPDARVTVSGAWLTLETAEIGQGNEACSGVKGQANPDDSGHFSWKGLEPGRYRIRIIAQQYAAKLTEPFTIGDGESRDVGTIRLEAGGGVRGRVADDRGFPVENAGVTLKDSQGRAVFLVSFVNTGSDGRYALQGIEHGSYMLRFEAKGFAPVEKQVQVDGAGGTLDVVLPRGGSIAVTVVDDQDRPVEGARIELYDAAGAKVVKTLSVVNIFDADFTRTTAQGTATIPDLAPGTYSVRAVKDGLVLVGTPPVLTVAPGQPSIAKIVLKPSGS